jgi:cytochrome P450
MTASVEAPSLFDHDYYQNPYPAFAWLRENDPVHRFRFPVGDLPMWIFTRFDDVRALLGDSRFSTNAGAWADDAFQRSGMVLGAGTVVEQILTTLDPPDHTRVRKLAMSAFTPRQTARWWGPTEEIVQRSLDRLESAEQPDVMSYASEVPAEVMGAVLGISLDRYEEMLEVFERAFTPNPDDPSGQSRAFDEIASYGRELIAEKRKNPADDLTTSFIQARDGDDRLTEDELVAMVALMIMVGLDTTRNLIGSAALALMANPDQRKLLADQPELIDSAVEEFMRYEGALTIAVFRFVTEDLEYAGHHLPAGAPVVLALQSANRDPRRFTDPDRLDITRSGPRHLGLGHGLHNCLGAALARLEARIAIPALFDRFPSMELAVAPEDVHYEEMWLVRSIKKLPVHLFGPR